MPDSAPGRAPGSTLLTPLTPSVRGLAQRSPVPGRRHAGPGPTQGSEVASQASALSAHPTCTDPNLPRPRLLPFGTRRPGPHDPPRMLHKHATSPRGRALQA